MMKTKLKRTLINAAALSMLSMIYSGSSHAVDVYLCAKQENVLMPDGVSVPMWGFAEANGTDFATSCDASGAITVPGPPLSVPDNDAVLRIFLKNVNIPEPISIVVPGQTTAMVPVFFTPVGDTRQRVRSFTHETETAATDWTVYEWTSMRPGTYVYQSGSHQAVQIQMGLYGSVVKNAVDEVPLGANAQAYPGIEYVTEKIVFYSEVDPLLHNDVASGTYGVAPGMTSTIDYNPAYFLINGGDAPVTTLTGLIAGEPNLLRFINMGLLTHAPVLHGTDMQIIAEDGHAYAYPRDQYSMLLAAGQTRDVIVSPTPTTPPGYFPMFDRMLHLTNRRLPDPPLPVPLGAETTTLELGDMTSSPGSLISRLKVGVDVDVDRIVDYMDNCSAVPNPSQVDTDNDGFGNNCDADLDNSGMVNNLDILAFLGAMRSQDLVADFNVDGVVNNLDIMMFLQMMMKAPGPSGING